MGTTKLAQKTSYIVGYFSPDGSKYVTSEGVGANLDTLYLTIYDFDRCSGSMDRSEFKIMDRQIIYGALAFSPDGHYLYVAKGKELLQYDMTADKILLSEEVVSIWDGSKFQYNEWDRGVELLFSTLVTGPDGKIYCVPPGGVRSLHTIEYPEERGKASIVLQNNIKLPTQNFNSLPNFPNFRTGPWDGSPCDTLGLDNMPVAKYRYEQDTTNHLRLRFTDLSYFSPDEWEWDFGDGTYHTGRKPYWHTFPSPGSYEVCLSAKNENGADRFCRTIHIGGTVGTDHLRYKANVTIFPNPAEDNLLITVSDLIPAFGFIKLYDVTGREVKRGRVYYGQNNLDISSLASGTYFWKFFDDVKLLKTGKLIKI